MKLVLTLLLLSPLACAQNIITTIAGHDPYPIVDGTPALSAAFQGIDGIARDASGNFFISDSKRNQVFEISTAGVVTLVAGNGSRGFSGDVGPATQATLNGPAGLAIDSTGKLYIADSMNNRVRVVVNGVINTFAGNGFVLPSAQIDGVGPFDTAILHPLDLLLVGDSTLYIAEVNGSRVRVIANGIVHTFAGTGNSGNTYFHAGDGGLATFALLGIPTAIARDSAGSFYIAASYTIRKVDTQGIISTIAGTGSFGHGGDGGPAVSATFGEIGALKFDSAGNLYLTDKTMFEIRKITPAGIISTAAGTATNYSPGLGDSGLATNAEVTPAGLYIDSSNNIYFGDDLGGRLRKIDQSGTLSTVAGNTGYFFSGDGGPATSAVLQQPSGVAVDNLGNVYIADTLNYRIRRIDSNGIINTVAGNGTVSVYTLPIAALQEGFYQPANVRFDRIGNMYVEGRGVSRISTAGVVDAIWGDTFPGWSVAFDSTNTMYLANFTGCQIKKVLPDGSMVLVAGTGVNGHSGDGGSAALAQINFPSSIVFDATGNLYFNESHYIRKVTPFGQISTFAGSNSTDYTGAMTIDRNGNLYVKGTMITPTGVATVFTGNGAGPALGDGGPAINAFFSNGISAVAVDLAGNIYIADTGNNRIRKVSPLRSGGVITLGPATVAPPGTVGHIPLYLTLPANANVDSVTAGVQVTPGALAPALAGTLTFQPDAAVAAPTLTDSNGTGRLSLAWLGVTAPFSGSVHLGDVLMSVPPSAVDGHTYGASITGETADAGPSAVTLTVSAAPTLTVRTTYLIGDASPTGGDAFGSFGDDALNTLDVLATLRAVAALPGQVPAPCTDRFDALDSAPTTPDGVLNVNDLLATLRRVSGVDSSHPRRTPHPCSVAESHVNPVRRARAGVVEFGVAERSSDGAERVPVYLRAYEDFSWQAMTFSIVGGAATLGWNDGDLGRPALFDSAIDGTLAAAWIANRDVHTGDRLLLGTITHSASERLVIRAVSASSLDGASLEIGTQ